MTLTPSATAGRWEPPSPSSDLVVRPPVTDRLTGAVGRVALVVAPGGYGKTSQTSAWAAGDRRPLAWYDVERRDNGAFELLEGVVTALRSVAGFDLAGLTSRAPTPAELTAHVIPAFGGALRSCPTPFVLVVDDVHLVRAGPATDVLDEIVRSVPHHSTVVMIGRGEPGTALARLRAHDLVVEIGAHELALDAADVRLLVGRLGVALDDAAAARVVEITEGWPVGVKLAGRELLEADAPVMEVLRQFGGGNRTVAGYVREEWLRGLPAADLDFLVNSSGLEWLSAGVCDAVLDRDDSAEILRRIHGSTHLVIPLDRRDSAYRLHGLLREVLDDEHQRRDRSGHAAVHARAAAWFERNGDIDRAVEHALAGGHLDEAERLVWEHLPVHHTQGRYDAVLRWLALFPDDRIRNSAQLCLMTALTTCSLGDRASATMWIRFGEQALAQSAPGETAEQIGLQIAALKSLISEVSVAEAVAMVQPAYERLPLGAWHVLASLVYGQHAIATGDDELGLRLLHESVAEAGVVGSVTLEVTARSASSIVHGGRGDWAEAVAQTRRARRLIDEHGLFGRPAAAIAFAHSALAEAMRGRLEVARDEWRDARRTLPDLDAIGPSTTVPARMALARAALLMGDRVAARVLLDEADQLVVVQPDAVRPRQESRELAAQLEHARVTVPSGPSALTTAELRVLHLLPTNLSLAEIAERLYVSRNTTKSHAASIYRKLGTTTRGDAVARARRSGLLPGDGDAVGQV